MAVEEDRRRKPGAHPTSDVWLTELRAAVADHAINRAQVAEAIDREYIHAGWKGVV